jgi:type VI secretion system secreted protein VgrG
VTLPVLPQASQPVAGLESGMQGAARVVDTVAAGVQVATALSQEGGSGPDLGQVLPGAIGALGGALGGASSIASGIDPGISQALGVLSAASSLVGAGASLVRGAVEAINGAVSEANRHRVTFEFESASAPATPWRVASFAMEERIGRPYVATIVLVNEDIDVDARAMLGEPATFTLRRGEDHERVIGGIVRRVEMGRATDRARIVTIELVPAIALLALRKDSRIFQDVDVTHILDKVMGDGLEARGREIEIRTRRTYPRREYCVQYGESELDFATRLMEEEGITYFFEHGTDGVERVILVDDPHAMVALLRDEHTIPFVQQREETSDTEHVHELTRASQLRTTAFTLRDLDWTQAGSATSIEERREGDDAQGFSREDYTHDRAVTLGPYDGQQYGRTDVEHRVRVRREGHLVDEHVLSGAGNVIRFEPGRTVTIEDHPVAELDGELLLLSVSHRGHAPELRDLLGNAHYAADDVSYECSFTAIPADVPYRMPLVTPKPRVHGMLSAIVTGASGQEIHSDEHRRVRIQMRWDREGVFDEKSSCFVRVMQSWAGQGFGTLFLPRVGMEVAVAFLDGDPDRPMVAGCLYDRDNPPPYTTTDDWTKSGIRTRSSPDRGGTHGNELTFDDAASHEKVYLHAERDLAEVVEHDHTTHVRRNQSNTVDNDKHERVGGNRQATIHGMDEKLVEGEHRVEVQQDSRHTLCGKLTLDVTGVTEIEHKDSRKTHIQMNDELRVDQKRNAIINQDDNTIVHGNKNAIVLGVYDIDTANEFKLHKGETRLVLADGVFVGSPYEITLAVASNRVSIAPSGNVRLSADTSISLVCGASSITLSADGTIDINGPAGINLVCGQSSVALAPSGVTTSGTEISSTAIADHTIVGAIVRIN